MMENNYGTRIDIDEGV